VPDYYQPHRCFRVRPYYVDDFVTLYHGDCREVLPALAPMWAVDAVVADPPYAETSLPWDRWPTDWPDAMPELAKSMWCFGSLRMFMQRASQFNQWQFSQDVVWEKHNGSNSSADRFNRVHELVAHFYRGPWSDVYHVTPTTPDATARTVRRKKRPPHWGEIGEGHYVSEDGGPRLMRSVIYARSCHGYAENETQKPEELVRPLIDYVCPVGGVIVVPFVGSGTDLQVAKMTGRRAIGVELREEQCEVTALRLAGGPLFREAGA
jgi:site-specific DNA-methyltransferase (adenine-specific)